MSPDAVFGGFYEQATVWINLVSQQVAALPVPYAFAVGMLATVNPCGFVMLPAFAAFYSTSEDATQRESLRRPLLRAIQMGVLVTIAFVAVFGLAGLIVTVGGRVIMQYAGWAGAAVGVLLVGLGAYQLVTRRSLFTGVTAGIRVQRSRSVRGALLFGAGYAICSLGCTLPAFLVVAGSVFLGNRDVTASLVRFVEYAAGMGAVLTLIAIGVAFARERTTSLVRPLLPVVDVAANLLLVLAGAYVIWYWTTKGVQI